jgi:hypothetical protein
MPHKNRNAHNCLLQGEEIFFGFLDGKASIRNMVDTKIPYFRNKIIS